MEYKTKSDIPDLYNVLNLTVDVCKQENCDELIKNAYKKEAKLCHPDKHPGRKDMQELFLMLTQAYNILADAKLRAEYNHKLTLNNQSSGDFFKLRDQAKKYSETIGEYKPATDEMKIGFKGQMSLLDEKHGYDSSLEGSMDKADAKKRMQEMNRQRALQDVNLKQERLFGEGKIDPKKFNAAFDEMHRKEESDLMMPHNGLPSAWNDQGAVASYSSFDDLNHLYVEDGNHFGIDNQAYSSIHAVGVAPTKKLTKDKVDKLSPATYATDYNVIDDNYYTDMKSKLAGRKSEAGNFDNMKYTDFKKDDFAGYGIFEGIGVTVTDKLTFDDEDSIASRFEKLKAERENIGVVNGGGNKRPTIVNKR